MVNNFNKIKKIKKIKGGTLVSIPTKSKVKGYTTKKGTKVKSYKRNRNKKYLLKEV